MQNTMTTYSPWKRFFSHNKGILIGGLVVFAIVVFFYIWIPMETVAVLNATVRLSTPLVLGALCGLMGERAAVINIGIEGQMLMSAFIAYLFNVWTGNLPLSILAGVLTGALLGLLLALYGCHPEDRPDYRWHGHQHPGGRSHRLLLYDRSDNGRQATSHHHPDLKQDTPYWKGAFRKPPHHIRCHRPGIRRPLCAVLYPVGLAHPCRRRAPACCRYGGDQCLQDALCQCDPGWLPGWVGGCLPHPRSGRLVRACHDQWAGLHCPGMHDFRQVDAAWLLGGCPVLWPFTAIATQISFMYGNTVNIPHQFMGYFALPVDHSCAGWYG